MGKDKLSDHIAVTTKEIDITSTQENQSDRVVINVKKSPRSTTKKSNKNLRINTHQAGDDQVPESILALTDDDVSTTVSY